jgi:hypothetical protein
MCTICTLNIEFAVEHPLALAVAVATRQAIDTGLLPETAAMDMEQSRQHATVQLTAVQQRVEQVLSTSRLLALPNFFVLMIESRSWGYYHPTLKGFDGNADPAPPRLEPDADGLRDFVVVVSQAASEEITKGHLPFAKAQAENLVYVDGPEAGAELIRQALTIAYPISQFSEFVCTEVA